MTLLAYNNGKTKQSYNIIRESHDTAILKLWKVIAHLQLMESYNFHIVFMTKDASGHKCKICINVN